MKRISWLALALAVPAFLAGCGGGSSTTTTISGSGLNSLGLSPAVATNFVQTENNLQIKVEEGPQSFGINTNLLYATVKVCTPGDATQCDTIDHVIVDTGSVGLRVLASKVVHAVLPPIQLSANLAPVQNAWQCFPFVIGGLWGANVKADIILGTQKTTFPPVAIQLIDDQGALAPTANCLDVTNSTAQNSNILSSAGSLGANGILGIGSTNLDCGSDCKFGQYQDRPNNIFTGSSVLYYMCPQGTSDPTACSLAPMDVPFQVSNPVSALATAFSGGVALVMPAIPDGQPGAATASGELILGVDTRANNTVPTGVRKVKLGVGMALNPDSYLSITTQFNGMTFANSYLDTGTNALFFYDPSIATCRGSTWYCPPGKMNVEALLSDGDGPVPPPLADTVAVPFQIGNFEALSSTRNTAFGNAAGYVPMTSGAPDTTTFAWGMPFFYGKKVYMSIWDITGPIVAPWYAWTAAPL
ncbi:DUF3443 family protein [Rhodoferax lacus]|uniref:DUF3443 family protein n=1 Tax=Rhodoferax lacus TaxID=2184758 RepID=UPI0013144230|nr:DUF3443 family protein [Rhodoferax lacus]